MAAEQTGGKSKFVWFDTARKVYGTMFPDIYWSLREGRVVEAMVYTIATATLGTFTVLVGDTVTTLEHLFGRREG